MSQELDQKPFDSTVFAENTEPRCPCVLLLDTSGSMSGDPILQLNEGLRTFETEIKADSLSAKRVEVAIVTFGPVSIDQEFVSVDQFYAPELQTSGNTPMGAAVEKACELLDDRKKTYKANGISYYRPWIFLITDGAPTDQWSLAAQRVKQAEAENRVLFFSVGVQGADMEKLKQISNNPPVLLNGLDFRDLFQWLSNSMKRVSVSKIGEAIELPPMNWGQITT